MFKLAFVDKQNKMYLEKLTFTSAFQKISEKIYKYHSNYVLTPDEFMVRFFVGPFSKMWVFHTQWYLMFKLLQCDKYLIKDTSFLRSLILI